MNTRRRFLSGFDALEKKRRRNAQRAQNCEQTEVVDVGQKHRLSKSHSVNRAVSLLRRHCDVSVQRQIALKPLEHLLKRRVVW